MIKKMFSFFRIGRVILRVIIGREIWVASQSTYDLTWFGNPSYGGWKIPTSQLVGKLAVIDAGVGEDISFSEDCIAFYGANVLAIDPTPRAEVFINMKSNSNIKYINSALASQRGTANFYLPTNESNVSGSLTAESHLKGREIEVTLTSLSSAIQFLPDFDTLIVKLDIEGAEFELLESNDFRECVQSIDVLCVEFHHRWPIFGIGRLKSALDNLADLGFDCVWCNRETNEEFTFLRNAKKLI
jgi:FkbM family methyltransferase